MFEDSVFEVTISDPDNRSAGTAFAVDRVRSCTYLLTCAHVIRAVGGANRVAVAARPRLSRRSVTPMDRTTSPYSRLACPRHVRCGWRYPAQSAANAPSWVSPWWMARAGAAMSRSWLAELTQMRWISGRLEDRAPSLAAAVGPRSPPGCSAQSEDLTAGISGGPVIDRDTRVTLQAWHRCHLSEEERQSPSPPRRSRMHGLPDGKELLGPRSIRGIELPADPGRDLADGGWRAPGGGARAAQNGRRFCQRSASRTGPGRLVIIFRVTS